MNSCFLVGQTIHKRFEPVSHSFSYPLFMMAIDLSELSDLSQSLRFFSHNRFNILSIRDSDYLVPDHRNLLDRAKHCFSEFGGIHELTRIVLITVPRYLGYVFNPVNFYYAYRHNELVAVMAEVTNTYHEGHLYVGDLSRASTAAQPDGELGAIVWKGFSVSKTFHVSPFFDEVGSYSFRLSDITDSLGIHITYQKDNKPVFYANFEARVRPIRSWTVVRVLLQFPLSAALTMGRILFEAMRLYYFRKVRAKMKPVPAHSHTIKKIPPTLFERLVKEKLFSRLRHIHFGCLTIELPEGEALVFGDNHCPDQVTVRVLENRFFRRIGTAGEIGLGESFVAGEWECDDVSHFLRLMIRNSDVLHRHKVEMKWKTVLNRVWHRLRDNTIKGSRSNIGAHYDLSNELYQLFLDPSMLYSSAVFRRSDDSLEMAQHHKMEMLIQKAKIDARHHVLEIGSGWGGMAIKMAQETGCKVTSITVSEAQFDWATQRVKAAGLSDRVSIVLQDYRLMKGEFDRIVSIEMLEAVGDRFLPVYFQVLDRLLAKDGIAVIQSITIPDNRYDRYLRRVDFIRRHVFPGGHLPSLLRILECLKLTTLGVVDVENIGPHYAETLRRWYAGFKENESRVRQLGFDDQFVNLWTYYLKYCEAAFEEQILNDVHLVLSRERNRVLYDSPCPSSFGGA